jgi:ATP-dependent helicase/nuclease subunit B
MSGFLAAPSPRWFTIPAHRPFLEDLAAGTLRTLAEGGPSALADATILLPTRRATRALGEAFLTAAGSRALLLPQIRALGDLDEGEAPFEPGDLALDLPPAISPLRRRFELARLVAENEAILERRLTAEGALELADALAVFLDACQIEETGDPRTVETLADGDLARHWQVSARFLNLALEAWPLRLEALGVMDVAARRVALLNRLAARWRERPPGQALIAAGSTGTAPAAAALLAAIAGAPQGCVVLPGLDKSLDEAAWTEVGEQHPQGSLKRLLVRAGLTRAQVADWDPAAEASARGRWRRRLINEALRPAERTADWLERLDDLRAEGAANGVDPMAEGLAGLSVITARTEEEAATVAALLLREALETPGTTAALITPDAALARRVSARLTRWGITADSSAGQPLASSPIGVLAGLLARAAVDPQDPVTLLAILKHPFTRLGLGEDDLRRGRASLERHGLRGPRTPDWGGLMARLQARGAHETAIQLAALIRQTLGLLGRPYADDVGSPAEAMRALVETLEALASGPGGGLGDLWSGLAGERAAALFSGLMSESDGLPPATQAGFRDLLNTLMTSELVRPGGASHPRLRILGVLEARLLRADRLILAGLEEGVWPAGAPIDPFLSRPMRERLGLPPPERRIGLSAHDFAQAAAAPEVVLLHGERRGGAPAVASRWLWRLRTLAKGAGVRVPERPDVLAWARALDAPLAAPPDCLKTAPRPHPTPPVSVRPREMAVTGVETWVRNPYAIYARHILKLHPLDRPDEPIEARARGTAIHAAFEHFSRDYPESLPDDPEKVFSDLVLRELEAAGMPKARMTREAALAAHIAPWVIAFERRRRPGARLLIEQRGEIPLDTPGGAFRLTARTDRIEARGAVADIIDFKTGGAPSAKQMRAGLAPQLTLTAAILAGGGFKELGAMTPGDLVYVRVSGGRIPGEELCRVPGEGATLAAEALDNLLRRIDSFDREETGYVSWAAAQFIGVHGDDYDHLARLWEWHVIGESEGEGGE